MSQCGISVDVDSVSTLQRFYGIDPVDTKEDPVYAKTLDRFTALFDEVGVKATFFIVADEIEKNSKPILRLKELGHEIANHSLRHTFGFSRLSRAEKEADITRSTEIMKDFFGVQPCGFRAPGYDIDNETLDVLSRHGYAYDSSLYNFLPYAIFRRMHYIKYRHIPQQTGFTGIMAELFPKLKHTGICELPVSVLPPNTTLINLLGERFFDATLWVSQYLGKNINYNFHASDLFSCEDGIRLPHSGNALTLDDKKALLKRVLVKLKRSYTLSRLDEMAHDQESSRV